LTARQDPRKLEGKPGAAFTTAGSTATGAETTLLSILTAMLIHGMVVQGRSGKSTSRGLRGAPDARAIKFGKELAEGPRCSRRSSSNKRLCLAIYVTVYDLQSCHKHVVARRNRYALVINNTK